MQVKAIEITEGVSKTIAAFFIGYLSLKTPKWLGLYGNSAFGEQGVGTRNSSQVLTQRRVFFDVAWNIFREVGEIGAFLIPFFLSGELSYIPASSGVGLGIAAVTGIGLAYMNKTMNTKYFAGAMIVLTGLLSTGLFSGWRTT